MHNSTMGQFTLLLGIFACALIPSISAFTNPIKTLNGSDPFLVYWDGM